MISALPRIVRYVANYEKLGIPAIHTWLTKNELSELSFWKDNSRRHQWLAGRWIAKRLASRTSRADQLREVEILSRGPDGLGKSPEVTVGGITSTYRLSISHSGKVILVGMVRHAARIGVDVASDVPKDLRFRSRWFTDQERNWIEAGSANRLPIVWALKESIFKACGDGSKWDPRSIELVDIEKDQVRGRICGVDCDPLTAWIRTTTDGAAAAVWCSTANKEVVLCS